MLELPPLYVSKQVMPRFDRSGASNPLTGHRCEFMIVDEPIKDSDVFPPLSKAMIEDAKNDIEKTVSKAIMDGLKSRNYGVRILGA